jgi:hypothetical protein
VRNILNLIEDCNEDIIDGISFKIEKPFSISKPGMKIGILLGE